MGKLDLILRGGTVVTPTELRSVDVGVAGGKIVALEPNLTASGKAEINASGLHVFPGVIDAHVHFNEPGRAEWEGLATGSQSLAAGGGTLFFDMPLNAHPPTVDAASFDLKLAAARASSLVDFAFWGGLVPGNVDKLGELAERGVIGFKAFMSNSGIEDFASVDDTTLREGMKRAAQLKKIVAVHAESERLTSELTAKQLRAGKTSIRDYLISRPIAAELEAIRRAIAIAGETGCALHIVHVSSGKGVALVAKARAMGADVTCETCPHYLVLTEDDVLKLGAVAKCAPPLRMATVQRTLWHHVATEHVTTIGSDHSPAPPDMKRDANFFKVWGGISGAQHTLPLLITEGHVQREIALPLLARMLSFNVAQRFNLPERKGAIKIGGDADLALVDLAAEFTVEQKDLFYRHKQSPYVGRKLRGKVAQTFVRGRTVFKDGKITAKALGELVRP
ncbi:MAG TPA: allantoinase [Verrucomicrobiae bacterium]|jgi:allantoinase|nr:allantoinase [Verrucomicrobiae bacterium]